MLDDLKRTYAGTKLLKYSEKADEQLAISWYKKQLKSITRATVN